MGQVKTDLTLAEIFLALGRRVALLALLFLILLGGAVWGGSQWFSAQLTQVLMRYQMEGIGAELLVQLRTDREVDLEHLGQLLQTLPADGEGLWHLGRDSWLERAQNQKLGELKKGALTLGEFTFRTDDDQRDTVVESLRLDTPDERLDLNSSMVRVHELLWASRAAHPGLTELSLVLNGKGEEVALLTGESQPGFPDTSRLPVLASLGRSASFMPRPLLDALSPQWPSHPEHFLGPGRLQLPVWGESRQLGVLRIQLSSGEAATVARHQGQLLVGLGLAALIALFLGCLLLAGYLRRLSAQAVGAPLARLSQLLTDVDADGDGHIGLTEIRESLPYLEAFHERLEGAREIQDITAASRDHLRLLSATLEQNHAIQEELKQALARLEEASQALVQASKGWMLAELGAWVAHDLNNKLQGAYSISSNWIELEKPCPVKHLTYLHASLEKAIEQIDQFRNLATPQDGERVDRLEAQQLLKDLKLLVSHRAEQAGIELRLESEPELSYLDVTPGKLQDLLMNLVLNACDAITQGGEPQGRIEVKLGGQQLVVTDNGVGIEESELAELFKRPFFTTKGEGGSGLGLRIVSSVAAEFGGGVECQSKVGEGSTFTVTLGSRHVEAQP